MRRMLFLACVVVLGCPTRSTPAAPKPCTKVGDSCQFAPGKLGTCVARDDCQGQNCLVCQSQH